MEDSKVIELNSVKRDGRTMRKNVTREEFETILRQVSENIGTISQGLMDDVNMMYSKQVFPFQMHYSALEEILIEKGIITAEEINARIVENQNKLVEKAKEVRETDNGGLEIVKDSDSPSEE